MVCFAPLRSTRPGLSVRKCGATVYYLRSACPVLRHSESGPLGLSGRLWVHRVCYWSDCLPHSPTLSQSLSGLGNSSPLRPGCLSPPLLLVWMNVSFLSTWCRSPLLFDSLSVLVVRGGAVCPPPPPSWFSKKKSC